MLKTKEVEIKINFGIAKYYENLGYEIPKYIGSKGKLVIKKGSIIIVKVEDLSPCSEVEIEVQCDYCGKIIKRLWKDYYRRKLKEDSTPNKKDCCYDCRHLKKKESDFLIYGVEHTTQLKSTQEKMKNSMINKYGCEYPAQNQYLLEKIQNTNLERYGHKCSLEADVVKEKCKETMIAKYGVDSSTKVKEILERMQRSRIITMYNNNTAPKSMQQEYIYQLIGGELNYPFNNTWLDIAFPEEKIYIEYDGSGHNLSVVCGNFTQKQFDYNEIKRYYFLKQNNWKMIKIISKKDYLPLDNTIIEIINTAKTYLNSDHSWIKFDIDNNIILCSEFNNYYNFGKLRKITKNDMDLIRGVL